MSFNPDDHQVGRYNVITSTLTLDGPSAADGSKHEIAVGPEGRLQAAIKSGYVDSSEAAKLPREPAHGKGKHHIVRREEFGRYNPIMHTLTVPGQSGKGVTVPVGSRGRLHAAVEAKRLGGSGMDQKDAAQFGVSNLEYAEAQSDHARFPKIRAKPPAPPQEHATGRGSVTRAERFGRYDPLTHTLAFAPPKTKEELRVSVGAGGRMRAVLGSGKVEHSEAVALGLDAWEPKSQMHPGKLRIALTDYNPISHKCEGRASSIRPSVDEQRRGRYNQHVPRDRMPSNPVTFQPHPIFPAAAIERNARTLRPMDFRLEKIGAP